MAGSSSATPSVRAVLCLTGLDPDPCRPVFRQRHDRATTPAPSTATTSPPTGPGEPTRTKPPAQISTTHSSRRPSIAGTTVTSVCPGSALESLAIEVHTGYSTSRRASALASPSTSPRATSCGDAGRRTLLARVMRHTAIAPIAIAHRRTTHGPALPLKRSPPCRRPPKPVHGLSSIFVLSSRAPVVDTQRETHNDVSIAMMSRVRPYIIAIMASCGQQVFGT